MLTNSFWRRAQDRIGGPRQPLDHLMGTPVKILSVLVFDNQRQLPQWASVLQDVMEAIEVTY